MVTGALEEGEIQAEGEELSERMTFRSRIWK